MTNHKSRRWPPGSARRCSHELATPHPFEQRPGRGCHPGAARHRSCPGWFRPCGGDWWRLWRCHRCALPESTSAPGARDAGRAGRALLHLPLLQPVPGGPALVREHRPRLRWSAHSGHRRGACPRRGCRYRCPQRAPVQRADAALRQAGALPRCGHALECAARLRRGRRPIGPARLEGRPPNPIAAPANGGDGRRRHLCDGDSGQPFSLPARPLRTGGDGGALLQAAQTQIENPAAGQQRRFLQAGPVPARLQSAVRRHDRMGQAV